MNKPAKAVQKQETTVETLIRALGDVGLALYKQYNGLPLNQAQRNLNPRCDYAEEGELKTYAGQILSVNVLDDGLVLGIVESFQKGMDPSDRAFRSVFFNVFGDVVYKTPTEEAFDTQKKAQSDFWRRSDEIEAEKITLDGLTNKIAELEKEIEVWRSVRAKFA